MIRRRTLAYRFVVIALATAFGFLAVRLAFPQHNAVRPSARQSVSKDVADSVPTEFKVYAHLIQNILLCHEGSPASILALFDSIDAWLIRDPRSCISYLQRRFATCLLGEGSLEDYLVSLAKDPASGLEIALSLRVPQMRIDAVKAVFSEIARNNPSDALFLLSAVPSTLLATCREIVSAAIVSAKSGDSLRFCMDNPNVDKELFLRVLEQLASSEPEVAVTALKEIPEVLLKERFGIKLGPKVYIRFLNKISPSLALELVSKWPPSQMRSAQLQTHIRREGAVTSESLQAFKPAFAGDPLLTRNFATAAASNAPRNPTLALEILNAIPSERARATILRMIGTQGVTVETRRILIDGITDPVTRKKAALYLKSKP